jgi:predicted thioesterase
VDGRWLTFKVEAFDDKGKIGEGTHTRSIIDLAVSWPKPGEEFRSRIKHKNRQLIGYQHLILQLKTRN